MLPKEAGRVLLRSDPRGAGSIVEAAVGKRVVTCQGSKGLYERLLPDCYSGRRAESYRRCMLPTGSTAGYPYLPGIRSIGFLLYDVVFSA
jgi:hypothetical protein